MVGIFFLQAVTDHREALDAAGEEDEFIRMAMTRYYTTLPTILLSLWGAISGGVQWSHMVPPLAKISSITALMYMFYIAFCLLAMMNVITGMFVESSMKIARRDEEAFTATTVATYFIRNLKDGVITWDDFLMHMESDELVELFDALNVDFAEARALFQLIDQDSSGTLTADELQGGWVRLQGPAKSLDLALHMRKFEEFSEDASKQLKGLEAMISQLGKAIVDDIKEGKATRQTLVHMKQKKGNKVKLPDVVEDEDGDEEKDYNQSNAWDRTEIKTKRYSLKCASLQSTPSSSEMRLERQASAS
jgi:hypothetical protein